MKQALNIAIDYMNERLEEHDAKYQRHPATEAERNNILADIEIIKEALARQEGQSNYCLQCEALSRELAALKAQQSNEQVEPLWYAVMSETAPIINKAIRSEDVANEYADKCRENYSGVEVIALFSHPHVPTAQPKEPEQNLKLMPREATPEMLKAMDECSMEGYDERLYEGHASSVYMAAWDAFHGQHCYCGDITNLGVIHRDDDPCHYPEHTSEYKRGYADAMNWKAQNHLEHLQPKVRTGDCLLTGVCASEGHKIQPKEPEQEPVAIIHRNEYNEYRLEPHDNFDIKSIPFNVDVSLFKSSQRTFVGLTDEEIEQGQKESWVDKQAFESAVWWAEAKLKEKNT